MTKLEERHIPPYIAFFRRGPFQNNRIWVQLVIYNTLLFLLTLGIANYTKSSLYIPSMALWTYFVALVTIILFALWALSVARRRMASLLPILLESIPTSTGKTGLNPLLALMYTSKWQLVTSLVLAGLATAVIAVRQPDVPLLLQANVILLVFIAGFVSGFGLWLGISSAYFVHKVSADLQIKLHPLFPAKDPLIYSLTNMMALYATLFGVQVALWVTPFAIGSRTVLPNLFPSAGDLATSIFVYLFAIILIPSYFLYPQLVLRRWVIKTKQKTILSLVQCTANIRLETNEISVEDIRTIAEYQRVLKEIENSPNFGISFTPVFRTMISIGMATFLAYTANPIPIRALFDALKGLLG